MKNVKLRLAWIIPNIFCYIMFILCCYFLITNAEWVNEIGRLGGWVLMLTLLLFTTVFGTYRILIWIKDGKI